MIAVFNENSSVVDVLNSTNAGTCVTFSNDDNEEELGNAVLKTYLDYLERIPFVPKTNWDKFEPYSAREATKKQVDFFNKIISK